MNREAVLARTMVELANTMVDDFDAVNLLTTLSDRCVEVLDGRWPRFCVVAMQAGFRAADAVPMRLRGQVIGALNLFRCDAGSLGSEDVLVAQALADLATIALLQHRTALDSRLVNDQLNGALNSRIIIEQGQGSGRRTRTARHGASVRPAACPRPQRQPPALRCRQGHRRWEPHAGIPDPTRT